MDIATALAPLDAQLRRSELAADEAVRSIPELAASEQELAAAVEQCSAGTASPVLIIACCLRNNHERPLLHWLQLLGDSAVRAPLSEPEVAALLRLELCCRGEASDLSVLPDCPRAWMYIRWPRPGGCVVVSRGHTMRVERLRVRRHMDRTVASTPVAARIQHCSPTLCSPSLGWLSCTASCRRASART